MKILPAEIDPATAVRAGGNVWYFRAGVLVARKVVKPVNRRTASQTEERSFMVAGMRSWWHGMDSADRSTWDAAAP